MIHVIKHIECEGPGLLGHILEELGEELMIVEVSKGDGLPRVSREMRAVITLGGPMNVYEEERFPFLKAEDAFIKEVVRRGIPYLGLCLGAQLLAKSGGAGVKKSLVKEVGWYDVCLTRDGKEDLLFEGVEEELRVFQWHEDTFDIPRGGVLMAEGKVCRNQAFKLGPRAYGLQFHLEVDGEMIKKWVKEYMDGPVRDIERRTEEMLNGYYAVEKRMLRQLRRLCSNFRRIMDGPGGGEDGS